MTSGRGHNGGPPLDEPVTVPRQCRWCRYWRPPPEAEARAYEYYRLGLSRRRVKRAVGACDQVLLAPGKPLSFSATAPESCCLNFSPKPPVDHPSGGGFVTIHEDGRLLWSGAEEDIPERYR